MICEQKNSSVIKIFIEEERNEQLLETKFMDRRNLLDYISMFCLCGDILEQLDRYGDFGVVAFIFDSDEIVAAIWKDRLFYSSESGYFDSIGIRRVGSVCGSHYFCC